MKRIVAFLGLALCLACAPQEKPGFPLLFDVSELMLDAGGSPKTITVTATEGTWTVTPSESWLTLSHTSGSGVLTLVVSATPNSSASSREATLDFSMPSSFSGVISVPVVQEGGADQGGGGEGGSGSGEGGGSGDGGGSGEGGDDPHPVSGLQYLGGYEIPAIDLLDKEKCFDSDQETFGNTKWFNYKTENPDRMVVTHTYQYNSKIYRNYTCMVDRTKQAPLWSAFVMHSEAYPDKNIGRKGSWTVDPGIPSDWQQESSPGSYSKGHFVASNYRQTTLDANKQTFYYTNQALQYQNRFNDGVWNQLENAVKGNAPSGRDTLYVVVGILYEDDQLAGGVPLPSHFYKLLMRCKFDTSGKMDSASGCAYLFKNEPTTVAYSSFITTIDAVEERAGFDFFASVPKNLQDAAEKTSSPVW